MGFLGDLMGAAAGELINSFVEGMASEAQRENFVDHETQISMSEVSDAIRKNFGGRYYEIRQPFGNANEASVLLNEWDQILSSPLEEILEEKVDNLGFDFYTKPLQKYEAYSKGTIGTEVLEEILTKTNHISAFSKKAFIMFQFNSNGDGIYLTYKKGNIRNFLFLSLSSETPCFNIEKADMANNFKMLSQYSLYFTEKNSSENFKVFSITNLCEVLKCFGIKVPANLEQKIEDYTKQICDAGNEIEAFLENPVKRPKSKQTNNLYIKQSKSDAGNELFKKLNGIFADENEDFFEDTNVKAENCGEGGIKFFLQDVFYSYNFNKNNPIITVKQDDGMAMSFLCRYSDNAEVVGFGLTINELDFNEMKKVSEFAVIAEKERTLSKVLDEIKYDVLIPNDFLENYNAFVKRMENLKSQFNIDLENSNVSEADSEEDNEYDEYDEDLEESDDEELENYEDSDEDDEDFEESDDEEDDEAEFDEEQEDSDDIEEALYEAAADGDTDEVKRLIDKVSNIDAEIDGYTPLMIAAENGNTDVVKLLIDNGADVNFCVDGGSCAGMTALMDAANEGYKEIVEYLLKGGADINTQDDDGWTALMFASCHKENNDVVQLLIDNEADQNIKNKKGKTALDIAKEKKNDGIVNVLSVKQKSNTSKTKKSGIHQSKKDDVDKRKEIIEKYLKRIAKNYVTYRAEEIASPANSQIFQNVCGYIAQGIKQSDVLGFIDTTIFGKGKNGLLFTKDSLYRKDQGESFVIRYKEMNLYRDGTTLFFKGSKWRTKGMLTIDGDCYLYNTILDNFELESCLKELKDTL